LEEGGVKIGKLIDEFFVTLQNDEWQNYISDAIAQCAVHWPIQANTERRVVDLLANQQRLGHLKNSIHQTLSYRAANRHLK
jgi:hypothetical protein